MRRKILTNFSSQLGRGQTDGHPVRLQVYRNLRRNQPQRGRAAGRAAVADSAQAGEPGKVAVSVGWGFGINFEHFN